MRNLWLAVVSPLILTTSVLANAEGPTTSTSAPVCKGTTLGPSSSAIEVAEKVQKTYDAIRTFKATFKQKYTMNAFNQEKNSEGTVTFVKPGKMHWDYSSPKDNVVVSDGKTLWSYVAADKQARKMQVQESHMPTALSFLTGKGNLAKEFKLELLDSKGKFENGYILKAIPKASTNLYSFVFFYVDGCTYQVRRVLIVDNQDNRNRFTFDNPVVNANQPDTKFQWSPPSGVQVISN